MMNNGDIFRKSTNEEIAEMFSTGQCLPAKNGVSITDCQKLTCKECWLIWLNKENNDDM